MLRQCLLKVVFLLNFLFVVLTIDVIKSKRLHWQQTSFSDNQPFSTGWPYVFQMSRCNGREGGRRLSVFTRGTDGVRELPSPYCPHSVNPPERFLSQWKSTKHLQVSGPLTSLTIRDVSIYKTGIQKMQPPSISNGHAGPNNGEELRYFICCSSWSGKV